MYGKGREVGPDLTGANRANLEYILGNVLTPSAVIQDEYKMHLVLTHDGRVFSGTHAGENERQLLLRVANVDDPVIIAKSEIESRVVAPVSMMPDGLLSNLDDQEVLNLVAYLRNLKQVPLPDE
jgi:putative heme-binding domain-containing protein